jgi:uncharacterized RDD family membrane protein YckC
MQETLPNSSIENVIADNGIVEGLCDEPLDLAGKKRSTLIEFPGTGRPLPEWRKQLSQRVREVQERKAREAAEEAAAAQEAGMVSCSMPSGQLELVPNPEQTVMNPIVSKALERLERARRPDQVSGGFNAGAATAPAFAPLDETIAEPEISDPEPIETKTRLTVVAPIKPEPPDSIESIESIELSEQLEVEAVEPLEVFEVPEVIALPAAVVAPSHETFAPARRNTVDQQKLELTDPPKPKAAERRPVRMISDSVDDVALSYLETCLSLPALAVESAHENAGLTRRMFAGVVDLLFVALMAAPVAAAIEFSDGDWSDRRVMGLMGGITIAVMFAYFTVSIALTGRTLAMRIFSLRTIDLRTGLIPTGGQSMKRAFGYIFALAVLGLGILYALIDPDGRTIYDRFSKTIVIRD